VPRPTREPSCSRPASGPLRRGGAYGRSRTQPRQPPSGRTPPLSRKAGVRPSWSGSWRRSRSVPRECSRSPRSRRDPFARGETRPGTCVATAPRSTHALRRPGRLTNRILTVRDECFGRYSGAGACVRSDSLREPITCSPGTHRSRRHSPLASSERCSSGASSSSRQPSSPYEPPTHAARRPNRSPTRSPSPRAHDNRRRSRICGV
jgi:hypothetical protein